MIFGQEKKVISINTIQELCKVGPTQIKSKQIKPVQHIKVLPVDMSQMKVEVENAKIVEEPKVSQVSPRITKSLSLKRLVINNGGEDIQWL